MALSMHTAPRLRQTAQRTAPRTPLVRMPSTNARRVEREVAPPSSARTSSIDLGWDAIQRDEPSPPKPDSGSSVARFMPTLPSAFSRSSAMETLPGIGPMLAPASRADSLKELRRASPGHVTLFDVDAPRHLPTLRGEHGARLRGLLSIVIVAVVGFAVGFGANFGLTLSRVPTRSPGSAASVVPQVRSALPTESSRVIAPAPEPVETPPATSSTPANTAHPADSAVGARTPSGVRARRRPSLRTPGASDNPY